MVSRSNALLGALLLALATLVVLAPSGASVPTVVRIEGERRNVDAGPCTTDGERMIVRNNPLASGGQALEFPQTTTCWAEYVVSLTAPATRIQIGSFSPGGAGECEQWLVLVDNALFGQTEKHCSDAAGTTFRVLEVPLQLRFAAGSHNILVISEITSGPGFANAYVDYLDVTVDAALPPLPGVPPMPAGDADRDGVPDSVESSLCGRQLVRDLLVSLQQLGSCPTFTDYTPPPAIGSADGDAVPDALEPTLCRLEDQNSPADGVCVANNYDPPIV